MAQRIATLWACFLMLLACELSPNGTHYTLATGGTGGNVTGGSGSLGGTASDGGSNASGGTETSGTGGDSTGGGGTGTAASGGTGSIGSGGAGGSGGGTQCPAALAELPMPNNFFWEFTTPVSESGWCGTCGDADTCTGDSILDAIATPYQNPYKDEVNAWVLDWSAHTDVPIMMDMDSCEAPDVPELCQFAPYAQAVPLLIVRIMPNDGQFIVNSVSVLNPDSTEQMLKRDGTGVPGWSYDSAGCTRSNPLGPAAQQVAENFVRFLYGLSWLC